MNHQGKKIWLITGISSGLGKSLADAVLAKDDFVIGTFRQDEQVAAFNQTHQDNALAVKLDVNQSADIQNLYQIVQENFGRLDILVNNAGVGFAGAVEEASLAEVRAVFETNFFGVLDITQTFLPLFRAQKSGHILQISSHGGIKAFAGFGIYNASKFALEGISEALAQEIAPLGIKLTLVEPGPFRTKFAGGGFILADKIIEDYNETSGVFRGKIKGVDGKQEGDPDKAALAIIDITELEKPPLRLPLGKVPLVTISAKLQSVQQDLDNFRHVAEGTVFED